jgi:hypothetical protein
MTPSELLKAMTSRSENRKGVESPFDFSEFSVINGWNTVYDFGKRILGLAAFIAVSTALVPLWSPGQTALQYQMDENTRQIRLLQNVPQDISVLKQEMSDTRMEIRDIRDSVESIRVFAFTSCVGMLAFLASWVFNLFGGKLRRKETP